jgi:low temperature requirement protein LtrA
MLPAMPTDRSAPAEVGTQDELSVSPLELFFDLVFVFAITR